MEYDKKLEGLRGLCAIVVALTHLITFNFFGAIHIPFYSLFFNMQFAREAVLIFFVISGYVIGANHINTPFNYVNAIDYLKRRIIRLYPIYLIALVISIVPGYKSITWPQLCGHLVFVQGFWVEVIPSNVVLWSLSYEFAYYLAFLGLWCLHKQSRYLYPLLITGMVLYLFTSSSYTLLKSALTGWLFWLAGLYISSLAIKKEEDKTDKQPIVSFFLILLATYSMGAGALLLRILHIDIDHQKHVILEDIVYLPVCALIAIVITRRDYKLIKALKILAFALPALPILSVFYFKHDLFSETGWIYGSSFFLLGLMLLRFKNSVYSFEKLNHFGAISYAIYVFHFPIGFFLSHYFSGYLSGLPFLLIGATCWLFLTYGLSYFAEMQLQPYIKGFFLKRPAAPMAKAV